jgi:Tol biopolymer transport system component/transcriptional regulator with XRE-family HTH domain
MTRMDDFWNEGSAELLRRILDERHLRIEDLAELVRVDPKTIRNWLRTESRPTRPYPRNLNDLATALGMNAADFRAAAQAYAVKDDRRSFGRRLLRRSSESPGLRMVLAGAVAVGGLVLIVWMLWRRAENAPVGNSFSIPAADDHYDNAWGGQISPDGQHIAFSALPRRPGVVAGRQLFVVSNQGDPRPRPLPDTEGPFTSFFWDYAGRGLYVVQSTKLVYISINGLRARQIAETGNVSRGDSNAQGELVFGSRHGLVFVSPSGQVELRKSSEPHLFPTFLPDGKRVLFVAQHRDTNGMTRRDLFLMSLPSREVRLIQRGVPSRVAYSDGFLLYARECALFARPFDLVSGRLGTAEYKIKDDVWSEETNGTADFSVARNGALLTHPPPIVSPIVRVRLTARGIERSSFPISEVRSMSVSHRGDQVVLTRRQRCKQASEIWLWSGDRKAPKCLTCGRGKSSSPIFSRDDKTIFYHAARGAIMGVFSVDVARPGQEQLRHESADFPAPRDVSTDPDNLLIQKTVNKDESLWMLSLDNPAAELPVVATREQEGESARFSPDRKWLAFSALRADRPSGVYLLPVGQHADRAEFIGQGWRCRWNRDGTKIFYARGKDVMEYELATRATKVLFTQEADITEIASLDDVTFYVVTTSEGHNRIDGRWSRTLRAASVD